MYAITDQDFDQLVSESRAHGIDPRSVALVLFVESGGFDPASTGPGGKGEYNGLNQMSVDNLRGLGLRPEEWRALSAREQLPRIFEWWERIARRVGPDGFPTSAAELLAMNYLPDRYRAQHASKNLDAPLAEAPEDFYTKNIFYDPENTGAITLRTIARRLVMEARGARWSSILTGIAAAERRAWGEDDAGESRGLWWLGAAAGFVLTFAAAYGIVRFGTARRVPA